jgi:hypothetical protein
VGFLGVPTVVAVAVGRGAVGVESAFCTLAFVTLMSLTTGTTAGGAFFGLFCFFSCRCELLALKK